jgi:chromate reductase
MTLLGITGSLRSASYNTLLLRTVGTMLPNDVNFSFTGLRNIPMFDQDLEQQGNPQSVQALKEAIAQADGIVIATPEYSRGIPGALKNALDWISRGPVRPLSGKPVIVMSASTSPFGGIRAQTELRQLLTHMNAMVIHSPEVAVAAANTKFDENGTFIDEKGRTIMSTLLTSFVKRITLEQRINELV